MAKKPAQGDVFAALGTDELILYGEIGWDVRAADVGVQLTTLTAPVLNVRLNSYGGDASKWNPAAPRWADVVYLECRGPNKRTPGVVRDSGGSVDTHDRLWPKAMHRAAMVRIRAAG